MSHPVPLAEQTGQRVALTETCAFHTLHESVSDFGLDPEDYCGVLEADLGVGGVVNLNGRLYPPADFVAQNEALAARAAVETVDAEEDHPENGPTFRVAARVLPPRVEQLEHGAVRARGLLALVDNPHGQNIRRLHRIGVKIGSSSRGWGVPVPHKLDDKSPYLKANEAIAGETVLEIRNFQLETYDLVRVPSAGTYADPPTTEAREALRSLCEAHILREPPAPAVPTSEPDEAQEDSMDPKTIAELRQRFPGLVAELEAENRSANPLASLDEGKRKLVTEIALRVAESMDPKAGAAAVDPAIAGAVAKLTTDVAEAARKAEEAAQGLRDRIKAVEETNDSLRRDNERLVEEREREKLTRQLAEAVDTASKGNKHAVRLRAWLEGKVASGALKAPAAVAEEAKAFGDALEALATEQRRATEGKAPVVPVDAATGDAGITEPVAEGAGGEAPGLLADDAFLSDVFKATERQLGAITRT